MGACQSASSGANNAFPDGCLAARADSSRRASASMNPGLSCWSLSAVTSYGLRGAGSG